MLHTKLQQLKRNLHYAKKEGNKKLEKKLKREIMDLEYELSKPRQ